MKCTVRVSTRLTSLLFAVRTYIRSLLRFLQVAKCHFSCCVTISTSTHILPLSSLRWKILHFLLSALSKFERHFLHWQFFSCLSTERNHVTERHGKYLSSAETPAKLRGLCGGERASIVSKVYYYLFIIHSKYFPNSDWLKAHA